MDIYEYLKKDHAKVDGLFKQFEDCDDPEEQAQLVSMLTEELILHAESEQNTFYKALEKFNDSRDEAIHGLKEHKEIEDKLEEISNEEEGSDEWEEKVVELKEIVQHHVKEEEGEMFNVAKKHLNERDVLDIQEAMVAYKEKMQSSKCVKC